MVTMNINEKQQSWIAVGRRKTSIAKVTLVSGSGVITVNKKPGDLYFQFNSQYIENLKAPLTALGRCVKKRSVTNTSTAIRKRTVSG